MKHHMDSGHIRPESLKVQHDYIHRVPVILYNFRRESDKPYEALLETRETPAFLRQVKSD
jgi:hypothetical protein